MMEYNKAQYRRIDDKKILHKVKKHWIVLSVTMLAIIGGAAMTQINAGASTRREVTTLQDRLNTGLQKRQVGVSNPIQSQKGNSLSAQINRGAQTLHERIIQNATLSRPAGAAHQILNANVPKTQQHQSLPDHRALLASAVPFNNQRSAAFVPDSTATPRPNHVSRRTSFGRPLQKLAINDRRMTPQSVMVGDTDPVIASGVWGQNDGGTTPWTFTQNGVLTLTGGKMMTNIWPSYFTSNGDSNMHQVTQVITKANPVTGSDVIAPNDCSDLFGSLGTNANPDASIEPNRNWGTEARNELGDLKIVDVSHLNTSDVNNMVNMFASCDNSGQVPWPSGLVDSGGTIQKIIGLNHLKTSKVLDMNGMFFGQNQLHDLNMGNFDTRNLLNGIFDIMMFPGAQVTDMELGPYTFLHGNAGGDGTDPWYNIGTGQYLSSANGLEDGNSHSGNWVDARSLETSGTWNQCPYYEINTNGVDELYVHSGPNGNEIDDNRPGNVNWGNVQHIALNGVTLPNNVQGDFADCPNLQTFSASDVDASQVSDMDNLFSGDTNLQNLGFLYNWNVSGVHHMSNTFNGDSQIDNVAPLQKWNTSHVQDMSGTFANDTNLQDLYGLRSWNTSSVNNMSNMFANDNQMMVFPIGPNLHIYNAGGQGSPNISGHWVNENETPTDMDNRPPVGHVYYNTENDVQARVTYRFGRQVLKTLHVWLPQNTLADELPPLPGYSVDPRDHTVYPVKKESGSIDVQVDKTGQWGSAHWYLTPDDIDTGYGKGNLYLDAGVLSDASDGQNDGALNHVIPVSDRAHVDTISTSNRVSLPQNSHNLFRGGSRQNNFPNLYKIDLSKAYLNNVTNLSGIFNYDNQMETLNMSNFNPNGNVTNRQGAFADAFTTPSEKDTSLAELDLNNTNTAQLFGTSRSDVGLAGAWVNARDSTPVNFFDGNSHPGTYVNTNKAVMVTLQFEFGNQQVGSTHTDWFPKRLFTAEVRRFVPTGYDLDPGDPAYYDISSNETLPIQVDEEGLWGKAEWLLNSAGHLTIRNGDMEDAQIPYTLQHAPNLNQSNVTSIDIDAASAPVDSSDLFASTSDGNHHGGFASLQRINPSGLYTDGAQDLSGLFAGQSQLSDLDLSSWHTGNTSDFSDMFNGDTNLKVLRLDHLSTVRKASNGNLYLSGRDSNMFKGAPLRQITLSRRAKFDHNSALSSDWLSADRTDDLNVVNLADGRSNPGSWTRNAEVVNYDWFGNSKGKYRVNGSKDSSDTVSGQHLQPHWRMAGYVYDDQGKGSQPNSFKLEGGQVNEALTPDPATATINYRFQNQVRSSHQFSGFYYQTQAGHNDPTQMTLNGSGIRNQDGISVDGEEPTGIPSDYHLSDLTKNRLVPFDNLTHNVDIEPDRGSDTVDYMYKSNNEGSHRFTGNVYGAKYLPETSESVVITSANDPGLNSGFHLVNASNGPFHYAEYGTNQVSNVSVAPNQETIPVDFYSGNHSDVIDHFALSGKNTDPLDLLNHIPSGFSLAVNGNQLNTVKTTLQNYVIGRSMNVDGVTGGGLSTQNQVNGTGSTNTIYIPVSSNATLSVHVAYEEGNGKLVPSDDRKVTVFAQPGGSLFYPGGLRPNASHNGYVLDTKRTLPFDKVSFGKTVSWVNGEPTVYFENVEATVKTIFLNQDGQEVGHPAFYFGQAGKHVHMLYDPDDQPVYPKASDYSVAPNQGQYQDFILQPGNHTVYIHLQGKPDLNAKVNVVCLLRQSDGDYIRSDRMVPLPNYSTGDSDWLGPSDVHIKGYLPMPLNESQDVRVTPNMINGGQRVVFYYEKTPGDGTLLVHYTDPDGWVLNSEKVTKRVGSSVVLSDGNSDAPLPEGYSLDSNDQTNYTITDTPQEIYLPVTGQTVNHAVLTVYQLTQNADGSHQTMHKRQISLSGKKVGDLFHISPYGYVDPFNSSQWRSLTPSGYYVNPSDQDQDITITPNQTLSKSSVYFGYTKDFQSDQVKTVRIHYILSDGTPVDTVSDHGAKNASFDIQPYLDDLPADVSNNYEQVDSQVYSKYNNAKSKVGISSEPLKYGNYPDLYIVLRKS